MKKLFSHALIWMMATGSLLATPVLFSPKSLDGNTANRQITVTPDIPTNGFTIGTNLTNFRPFVLQPVNGVVTTNLTPWGYNIQLDGWPRAQHIVVPNSATTVNVTSLFTNAPFQIPTGNWIAPGGGVTIANNGGTNYISAAVAGMRYLAIAFTAVPPPSSLFIFTGETPTNMASISGTNALLTGTADYGVRDPGLIKVNEAFYAIANNNQSNSLTVFRSTDLRVWTNFSMLYVPLPTNYVSAWSPAPFIDGNGGLRVASLIGIYAGIDMSDPDPANWASIIDYATGVGTIVGNFEGITNFSILNLSSNAPDVSPDKNSAKIFLDNGTFYLFTGDGNEYSATYLSNTNWLWRTNGLLNGPGKAIAKYAGKFYLTSSQLGWATWQTSTDLLHWAPQFTTAGLVPPRSGGAVWQEGTFSADLTTTFGTPQAVDAGTIYGKFNGAVVDFGRIVADGSGLSNLQASAIAPNSGPIPVGTLTAGKTNVAGHMLIDVILPNGSTTNRFLTDNAASLTNFQGVLVMVLYTNTAAGSILFTTNAGNVFEWIGTNGFGGINGLVATNAFQPTNANLGLWSAVQPASYITGTSATNSFQPTNVALSKLAANDGSSLTNSDSFSKTLTLSSLFNFASNFVAAPSNCPSLTYSNLTPGVWGAILYAKKLATDTAGSLKAGLTFSPNVTNEDSVVSYAVSVPFGFWQFTTAHNEGTASDIPSVAVGAGANDGAIYSYYTFTCTNTTAVAAAFEVSANTTGSVHSGWLKIFKQ